MNFGSIYSSHFLLAQVSLYQNQLKKWNDILFVLKGLFMGQNGHHSKYLFFKVNVKINGYDEIGSKFLLLVLKLTNRHFISQLMISNANVWIFSQHSCVPNHVTIKNFIYALKNE